MATSPAPLAVGDTVADFSLTSQHGEAVQLRALLQKGPVVLFFYPKDNTHVCTQEVCGFRDAYEDFVKAGATVVGISSDDETSHASFAKAQNLPYLLLSDKDGGLRRKLGVPKTLGMMPGRVTYVLDRQGVVRLAYAAALSAQGHIDSALRVVRELASSP